MFDIDHIATLARIEGPCETMLLRGKFETGASVSCPDCGDEHELGEVMHIPVATSLEIGDTIHVFVPKID